MNPTGTTSSLGSRVPYPGAVMNIGDTYTTGPEEAALTATLCKAHLSEVGRDLVRKATEVHGGIGFTDAYDLQLWFKRVGASRQLLGGPEWLRARAAALQSLA